MVASVPSQHADATASTPGADVRRLGIDAGARLLVVAPHPDDETIGCGELIQQVHRAGGTVAVLLLTDGDNNPWPQRWMERRLRIDAAARARWGARRRRELTGAMAQLGIAPAALHALGWRDLELTAELCRDAAPMLTRIAQVLEHMRPTLIGLPALGDRHPDHGVAHVLLRLALARTELAARLLAYPIHQHDAPLADVALPEEHAVRAHKLAALEAYRSQLVLSGTRMRRFADRTERYLSVPSDDAIVADACLPWRPPRWLRPWLRLTVADANGTRDWRWPQAPLARDADGRFRLDLPRAPGPRFAKLHLRLPSPWIFDRWGWCEA